jgi:hypothetical protein
MEGKGDTKGGKATGSRPVKEDRSKKIVTK